MSQTITVHAAGHGNPAINLRDGHDLLTSYVGPEGLRRALEENRVKPLSLASADFDEDGVPDLVSGYAYNDQGIVTLLRGNIDSIYPNTPEAKQRQAEGTFTDAPFLSPAVIFEISVPADFLGAGDFDADGHWDLVVTARSSDALFLLSGDGTGGLRQTKEIPLPGLATALTTGEMNRADGLTDIILGATNPGGSSVLVFEGPEGALRSNPELFEMPARVTSLQLAQLDGEYTRDLAVASGDELVIVHGRDRKLSLDETERAKVSPAVRSQRQFDSTIISLAFGNFAGDAGADLAIGTSDGLVQVLSSNATTVAPIDQWSTSTIAVDGLTQISQLTTARVSTSGYDDLLATDKANRRLQVLHGTRDSSTEPLSADPLALDTNNPPVAVLPIRLTPSALNSLIVLKEDQGAPAIANIEPQATFTVVNTNASGPGSLQFAILDANETPGADQITFNIPGTGPFVINQNVQLPTVTDPVTIDGTTQPGFAGTPIIELIYASNFNGLKFGVGSNTFRGIAMTAPGVPALEFQQGGNNIVEGNFLGTNISGTQTQGRGDVIINTANNRIGGTVTAARNLVQVIASHVASGADGNVVLGNFIGLTINGNSGGIGAEVRLNSAATTIGGTVAGARNVIVGEIIIVNANPAANLIQGNYIGTDVSGTIGLSGRGIFLDTVASTVGGTTPAARNLVSGNTGPAGIRISTANDKLSGSANLVQGNFIGTNVNGTGDLGNAGLGVLVDGFFEPGTIIGGAASEARNVIANNKMGGVEILSGKGGVTVQGNFIGTDAAGALDLGNLQNGIHILNSPNNVIGGLSAAARNVISGNGLSGVLIEGAPSTGNVVLGNYIGTSSDGLGALGNDLNGVTTSQAPNNTVGGSVVEARNIISASARHGVSIGIDTNSGSTGITVQNNYIGTDVTGASCLGNQRDGVFVNRGSVNHTIIDNLITCNARNGVNIPNFATNDPGIQIQVVQNSIYGNGLLGIDLGDAGITPNDPQDPDAGANFQQNFPVLTSFNSAVSFDGRSGRPNGLTPDVTVTVNGALNSTPNTTYTVHWYFSAAAQCVTNQAASRPLVTGKVPNVTTNAGGDAQFNFPLDFPVGINNGIVNCTATDPQGNTSEFSACFPVNSTPPATRTLTVASTNPGSGVNITVSPNDNNAVGSGATQFTRTYNTNTVVSLTAPATAGGNNFQNWLRDGADFANNTQTSVSVTMDANHTMTAVYVTPPTVQLDSSSYTAAESVGSKVITVTRTGDTTGTASVNYTTSDTAGSSNCNVLNTGQASSRCDYITTVGTLSFAAGETARTISIPIIDDAYAEDGESFTVTLSNATGATLGSPGSAPVTITDNENQNGPNPIGQARYYVRMHYLDFLNREPDPSGWDFWTNQITACGSDVGCNEVRRVDVSASFFLSIEFQQTGYLVERTYKTAYGDATGNSTFGGTHTLTVPVIRFDEFLADTQQITRGVVVLQTGWEQLLESNKVAFFNEFVQRTRFTAAGAFPPSMTAAAFVDQLNTRAGNPLSAAERNQLMSDLTTSTKTRAQVLRVVAEHQNLVNAEFNRAFVLMQYFGYLRRNPNDPQDTDYTGYDFWLVKLNQFSGNYNSAEMVKAFITSIEYGRRFGP